MTHKCLLCGNAEHTDGDCPIHRPDPRLAETERITRNGRPALDQRPMGCDEDGE